MGRITGSSEELDEIQSGSDGTSEITDASDELDEIQFGLGRTSGITDSSDELGEGSTGSGEPESTSWESMYCMTDLYRNLEESPAISKQLFQYTENIVPETCPNDTHLLDP